MVTTQIEQSSSLKYFETINYFYHHLRCASPQKIIERLPGELDIVAPGWRDLRTIHVTGTSGKGTTAMTLANILSRKYRVGLLISPHLFSFAERISINGKPVACENIVSYWDRIKTSIDHSKLTFQELLLLLAMISFVHHNVDICVLEVGRGGRSDMTSVLRGELTIITYIGKDHIPLLGNNIFEIAQEKAGIVSRGTLITGENKKEIIKIFNDICSIRKAALVRCSDAEKVISSFGLKINTENHFSNSHLKEITVSGKRKGIHPMLFPIQRMNIALASMAANFLGISDNDILSGIQNLFLPGRLEIFDDVIGDVAHNPDAVEALMDYFSQVKPVVLMGVATNKDIDDMVQPLCGRASAVIFTKAYRGVDSSSLKNAMKDSLPIEEAKISDALSKAKETAEKLNKILVVTGSTFVIDALFNSDPGEKACNQGAI